MNIWKGPENSWDASLLGDEVVYGRGGIGIHNFNTNLTKDWTIPGVNTYQGGFGLPNTFLRAVLTNPDGSSKLEWVNTLTDDVEFIQNLPPNNSFKAGPGLHWAAVCSSNLWWDKYIITQIHGRPIALSLTPDNKSALAVACASSYIQDRITFKVYLDGIFYNEYQAQNYPDTVENFQFVWPNIYYGYGKPHILNLLTGLDKYVGAFPNHNECFPSPTNNLIWTAGQVNKQLFLCGRQVNDIWGKVINLDGATQCNALTLPIGDRVAVNNGNLLTVYDIPSSYPTTLIPKENPIPPVTYLKDKRAPNPIGLIYEEPVNPDPIIAPFNHFFHFGSFYDAGHKYLNNDDWSKDKPWLTCPGNVSVVTGEAVAAMTSAKDVIITPDAIFTMAETPELWSKVKAIYLAAEMSSNPIKSIVNLRETCNFLMYRLGVKQKPFITYTTDKVYSSLSREDTWIGLQFYISQGEPLSKLNELNDNYHNLLGNNENIAIIGQTYDRNGTYKEPLSPILEKIIEIARTWSHRLQAWINFSDGRGSVDNNYGGVRWHPELYPILRSIMKAIPNA